MLVDRVRKSSVQKASSKKAPPIGVDALAWSRPRIDSARNAVVLFADAINSELAGSANPFVFIFTISLVQIKAGAGY